MFRLYGGLILLSVAMISFADEIQADIPFKPSMDGLSDYIIRLFIGLIVVFLIALAALVGNKNFNKWTGLLGRRSTERNLKILEFSPLGKQATLYLVAYGKMKFIIACTTSGQVTLIDKIQEE